MTRFKEIEKAAKKCYYKYSFYHSYNDEETIVDAFTDGAEWADSNPAQDVVHLNDVWHDAEEFPAEVGAILYRTHLGQFRTVCHGTSGEGIWKVFVKDYGVAEWAYVNELRPKGGEI